MYNYRNYFRVFGRYFRVILIITLSIDTLSSEVESTKEFIEHIDSEIPVLMENFIVPGVAVALIQSGTVVFEKEYGYANVRNKRLVTDSTGFNVGSISKAVSAWGVMRLVEQGKVSLDESVEKYLKRWKLPDSPFNNSDVTVRRLLSHTAGISVHGYPGWRPNESLPSIEESLSGKDVRIDAVRVINQPGTRWQYSGGGYTICQLLIEEVSGQKFEDFMYEEVLKPLGMYNSDFELTGKIKSNSSQAYNLWGESTPSPRFTAKAAAGFHTTLKDFTKFALQFSSQPRFGIPSFSILKQKSIDEVLTAVPAANGMYGLGIRIDEEDFDSTFIGHYGANLGWHSFFNMIPKSGDGLVLLTNSSNGHHVNQQVICQWKAWVRGRESTNDCVSVKPVFIELMKTIKAKGIDAAIKQYTHFRSVKANVFKEFELENLGHELLFESKFEQAIKVFRLNVNAFPKSANALMSLGEAYRLSGNPRAALMNFKSALALEPKNTHAKRMVGNLDVESK